MTANSKISSLLFVERSRNARDDGIRRFFPVAVLIVNLLVCGILEEGIKSDVSGHSLSVFLIGECAALIILASIAFLRTMSDEIRKTAVLPVSMWEYYAAIVLMLIRNPVLLALECSAILFLSLPAWKSAAAGLIAAAVAATMFAVIALACALAFLWVSRSRLPLAGLVLSGVLIGFGIALLALFTHSTSLIDATPVLSWAAKALSGLYRGELASAMLALAMLAGSGGMFLFIARIQR